MKPYRLSASVDRGRGGSGERWGGVIVVTMLQQFVMVIFVSTKWTLHEPALKPHRLSASVDRGQERGGGAAGVIEVTILQQRFITTS